MSTTTSTAPFRKIDKPLEATWLDQRGSSQCFHLDSQSAGHRVTVHRWFEDGQQGEAGEVRIKRIYGNFWRGGPGTPQLFDEVILQDPTDEQIAAVVCRMGMEGARVGKAVA